jgi:hypothetical protein
MTVLLQWRHSSAVSRTMIYWNYNEKSIPGSFHSLALSNPIFLPPTYSPALIHFGRERGWWVTCNYPTVLKQKNRNRNSKSTTCAICWPKSVLHEEKRREQENHNVGRSDIGLERVSLSACFIKNSKSVVPQLYT